MQRGHPCVRLCWCWISGLVTRIEQSSRLSATGGESEGGKSGSAAASTRGAARATFTFLGATS